MLTLALIIGDCDLMGIAMLSENSDQLSAVSTRKETL